jgi:hypothetical protein
MQKNPPMLLVMSLGCILVFLPPLFAKTGHLETKNQFAITNLTSNKEAIQAFENAITPFLRQKTGIHTAQPDKELYLPRDGDFFFLARNWRLFSESFRQLYLKSLQLPTDFSVFIEPTGKFEIYYTTSGISAVEATDEVSFGPDSAHWRYSRSVANGIPDYVDQVAWSLDSAWSMIVDRFGFSAPIPYKDTEHPSSRYKIVLKRLEVSGEKYYAFTNPIVGAANDPIPTYMEIFNNFKEFAGYEHRPEQAIYVTSPHELFHAVQFAMGHAWNSQWLQIDDLSLGWLEGTAVMMEDLCFDYINDYLQYLSNPSYQGKYFDDPTTSVLLAGSTLDAYTNGIVALYLYEFSESTPSIDFIQSVFTRNSQKLLKFSDNLSSAAVDVHRQWNELLHSFHVGSYFTGSRFNASRFYKDGALIPQWKITPDVLDSSMTIVKNVKPYAMQTFAVIPETNQKDTVYVEISPTDSDAILAAQRQATLLLIDTAGNNSVYPISLAANGAGEAIIDRWQSYDTACVIISSAHPAFTDRAHVSFVPVSWSQHILSEATSIADTLTTPFRAVATLTATPSRSIVGNMTIAGAAPSPRQVREITDADLMETGLYFQIDYPIFWKGVVAIDLTINAAGKALDTLKDTYDVSAPFAGIYRYNLPKQMWDKIATQSAFSGDTATWHCRLQEAGTYAVLQPRENRWYAYPNPISLSGSRPLTIEGIDMIDLALYSIAGNLIIARNRDHFQQSSSAGIDRYRFIWYLANQSGTSP